MSAKTQIQQERPLPAAGNDKKIENPRDAVVREMIEAAVKREIAALNGSAPKFSADDRDFLIWMTGFTAGANFDRDGERGERIFAWCRQMREKLCPNHENPS